MLSPTDIRRRSELREPERIHAWWLSAKVDLRAGEQVAEAWSGVRMSSWFHSYGTLYLTNERLIWIGWRFWKIPFLVPAKVEIELVEIANVETKRSILDAYAIKSLIVATESRRRKRFRTAAADVIASRLRAVVELKVPQDVIH